MRLDQIREQLGEPAYRREGVALYQGDCLDLLARLRAGTIDLTVTSPPYNIGKEYESHRSVAEYVDWCSQWIRAIEAGSSPHAAFWLNVGYCEVPGRARAIPIPYLLWDHIPFYLIQEIIWNYGAGVACRHAFSPRNEKFLWYVRDPDNYVFNLDNIRDPDVKYPNQKKNGKLKCNPLGKNPTDVWQFAKVTSGKDRSSVERTAHPAQFPLAVIERIIRGCSNENDLVLDPFAGSGTTLHAAALHGREAIGFEIEPRYISIAAARLDSHFEQIKRDQAQGRLFYADAL